MATAIFEVEITSPLEFKTYQIECIEVQSPTGSFFVGPNHAPLISLLKKKSIVMYKRVDQKNPETLDVSGGFFKVSDNKALILLDG